MSTGAATRGRSRRRRAALAVLLLGLAGSLALLWLGPAGPPPRPVLLHAGFSTASPGLAVFVFTGAARFECALDGVAFAACASPARYAGLARGRHLFMVRGLGSAGAGVPAVRHWTVRAPGGGRRAAAPVVRVADDGTSLPAGGFAIAGALDRPLAPGRSVPLRLRVRNPNAFPIEVTHLRVRVAPGSSRTGCDGPSNLAVRQPGDGGAVRLVVPAGGVVSLPAPGAAAPRVRLRDLPVSQDACQGARFRLLYDGSARREAP